MTIGSNGYFVDGIKSKAPSTGSLGGLRASRVNRNGCATREQSSDAERDCLVQRKRKAGQKPGLYTREELNGDHKQCGVRGAEVQAVAEKEGARKSGWPDGQAKEGRKQGEARLQTLK